jgi:hypothetical protein
MSALMCVLLAIKAVYALCKRRIGAKIIIGVSL